VLTQTGQYRKHFTEAVEDVLEKFYSRVKKSTPKNAR